MTSSRSVPDAPGHEGAEGRPEGQLDVGAGRAVPVPAPHVPLDDEQDVRAVVAVATDDDAGVPLGVEREVLGIGREGQPLLPHRRHRPVGVADRLHLLPGDVGVVGVAERRLQPRHLHIRPRGVVDRARFPAAVVGSCRSASHAAPTRAGRSTSGSATPRRTPVAGTAARPPPMPRARWLGHRARIPPPTAQRVHSSPRPRPRASGIVPTSWIPATAPLATTMAAATGRPSCRATTARTSGPRTASRVASCACAASRGRNESA